METRAHLKHDFSLESFSMTIHSSLFTFKASGTTQGNRLKISTSGADQTQTEHEIEFDSPPYLAGGILLDLAASLKTGKKSKTYDLFDPVTMAFLPATAEVKGIESIEAFGKQTDALMVDLSFKGATQTLWMDQKGRILLESGMLGMRIKAVEQQEALTGINSAPVQDMTRLASVRADRKIPDPEALNTLVVDISGIDVNQYPFRTRRQRLAGKRLTIKKERIPNTHTSHIPFDLRKLTKPGPFIQSDTPEIMALAQEITQGETLAVNKVRKLVDWVYKNIEKRPSPSIPDALSTLKTRKGDCNEHAVLLAALGRAAGIPTRVETGLYYLDGKFMYHAWNAFYTGAWITADGVFNQIPADVTHIRIASSKKGTGTELTGVIGNIQLKIIEMN
ncbi:MAG: transglutaminase domain-containing protein [Desulfobacteraceae bacterium]|nr:MAG: transglutaminase domain-containing protein [Desulfobacteraceae bacterium]